MKSAGLCGGIAPDCRKAFFDCLPMVTTARCRGTSRELRQVLLAGSITQLFSDSGLQTVPTTGLGLGSSMSFHVGLGMWRTATNLKRNRSFRRF